jgi:hypothetical protein
MGIINTRQLARLLVVAGDSILPLWRIIPGGKGTPRGKVILKWLNVALLMFGISLIILLGTRSPFRNDPILDYRNGAIVMNPRVGGIRIGLLYAQAFGGMLLISMILWAFLLDIKDAMSGQLSERFSYYSPENSLDSKIWGIVVMLLVGYVARIWLFGVCYIISSKTANTFSVLYSGISAFNDEAAKQMSRGIGDLLLNSLQSPLGVGGLVPGGTYQSVFIVAFLSLSRVILITFLLGAFGLVLRRVPPAASLSCRTESEISLKSSKTPAK